jgi:Protein of unknown function (DUF2971)
MLAAFPQIVPLTPEQQRLFQIFHPHAAAEQAAAFANGTRFVSYTRAETAVRILKSKRIWMRKSMCMNDFMEVQYGLQCLYQAYDSSEAGKRFQAVLDRLFDGLRNDIAKMFGYWTGHLRTDTYCTCVSRHNGGEEDHLGRLSMWRAYGGTSGVALVLNNAAFQSEAPSDVLQIYASPVAYVNWNKFVEKFEEAVTNIENEVDFINQQSRDDIMGRLFRMLAFAAVCTKHPGFGEELEWRVIYCPWWNRSDYMIKETEIIGGVPQPVYKIPLEDIPEKGLFGITIPALIDRIIIGPTRDPLAIAEAFTDLLAEAKVEQPNRKIFISDIPLRQ